jgi:F420-0:gamma-glutamyl ligase-like protein
VTFGEDPNLTPLAAVPLDPTASARFARSYAKRLEDEFSRRLGADAVDVSVVYDDATGRIVTRLTSEQLVWNLELAAGDQVESAARLADRYIGAGGGPQG